MSQRNETNDDKMRKKNFIKLFPARRAFKKKTFDKMAGSYLQTLEIIKWW